MPEVTPPENQPAMPASPTPPSAPAPQPAPAVTPPASPAVAKAFWTSFPGILTAIGGVIAAIAAMISALDKAALLHRPVTIPSPTAIFAAAPASTGTVAYTSTPPPPTASPATATVAQPSTPPLPTAPPSPSLAATEPAAPPGVLLVEDFYSPGIWETSSDPDYEVGYIEGEYRILVRPTDVIVWASPDRPTVWTDLAIEVDARQVEGSEEAEYGLLVRLQETDDSFYAFMVSSAGSFAIRKHTGETWTDLYPWERSEAVQGLGKVNHLQVECLGSRLRFGVNGTSLAEVVDAGLSAGDIALAADGDEGGEIDVRFDNLRVQVLKRFP